MIRPRKRVRSALMKLNRFGEASCCTRIRSAVSSANCAKALIAAGYCHRNAGMESTGLPVWMEEALEWMVENVSRSIVSQQVFQPKRRRSMKID